MKCEWPMVRAPPPQPHPTPVPTQMPCTIRASGPPNSHMHTPHTSPTILSGLKQKRTSRNNFFSNLLAALLEANPNNKNLILYEILFFASSPILLTASESVLVAKHEGVHFISQRAPPATRSLATPLPLLRKGGLWRVPLNTTRGVED